MSQTSRHCSPPNSSPCPSKQPFCTTEASLGNGPSKWRLCCNRPGFDGVRCAGVHSPQRVPLGASAAEGKAQYFPWLPVNAFSAALGSYLNRKDVSCGRIKLESQDPFTGGKATINFRRPKLPTLRGLQSQIGKILARSGRIERRSHHLA